MTAKIKTDGGATISAKCKKKGKYYIWYDKDIPSWNILGKTAKDEVAAMRQLIEAYGQDNIESEWLTLDCSGNFVI